MIVHIIYLVVIALMFLMIGVLMVEVDASQEFAEKELKRQRLKYELQLDELNEEIKVLNVLIEARRYAPDKEIKV